MPVTGGVISFRHELNSAFLTLEYPLDSDSYRADLTTAIKDLAGNALAAPLSWTFSSPPITYWDGGGDGISWHDPLNWNGDQVPADGDAVVIDDPSDITVNYSSGATTVYRLQSEKSLSLSGGTLALDSSSIIRGDLVQPGGTLTGSGTVTV